METDGNAVQQWTPGSWQRLSRIRCPPRSASPVWAEHGGRGGTAHPGQVGELCRKSRRLRAQHGLEQRSQRQGDWFFGSVAATVIRARGLRPEPGPGCGLLWVGAGGWDGRACSG